MGHDERIAMLEADAAAALIALERQRAGLSQILDRLAHVGATVLPGPPAQQWKGFAESAYETRLHLLRGRFEDLVSTVANAISSTDAAIASLGSHVG
jgi:hypothetical protein